MITKNDLEKKLKKTGKAYIYVPDGTQCTIERMPYIASADGKMEFDMDCKDLADYCRLIGLTITPKNKN